MADLTRLLAKTLTPVRQEREACGLRHDAVGHSLHQRFTGLTMRQVAGPSSRPAFGSVGRLFAGSFAGLCAGLLIALATVAPPDAGARNAPTVASQGTEAVALSALPRQAQDVHQRILAGGPFRYQKDGAVFGNRERLLPRQPRGFYREYTVPTPGERDRGARRIVCGGKEVRQPETCFYTRDHYASFQAIDPRH